MDQSGWHGPFSMTLFHFHDSFKELYTSQGSILAEVDGETFESRDPSILLRRRAKAVVSHVSRKGIS